MNVSEINELMQRYVTNGEVSGCALIVRQNGEIVYKNKWGYSNFQAKTSTEYNSVYRMMSMTKCVTAAAVMKLIEENMLNLDDKMSKYLPQFAAMRVADDKRYIYKGNIGKFKILWTVLRFNKDKVKTVACDREITIRDLLSHSSGLEQGVCGFLCMLKDRVTRETLQDSADIFSKYILGFQPGTGTGYSPRAGYDMLGLIIEKITGVKFEDYIKTVITQPLGMKDTTFFLSDKQQERLVRLYKRKNNTLTDVSGGKQDLRGFIHIGEHYAAGCGGLYSTVEDYERFAAMLCGNGCFEGVRILKEETVELMRTEASEMHIEPDPGCVWGLGVKIRQDPEKGKLPVTRGTYGWSGAFGTHFFVSPSDSLDAVFVTNRADLGGSSSYINKEVERLVFGCFSRREE